MSLIKKMRKQTAVYWKRLEPDQYGAFTFDAPVEIACRWEDCGEEFKKKDGTVQISTSMVYVDRVMFVGDKLMLGEMDSNTQEDPAEVESAIEIQKFDTLPNLRNTENLYTAYL